MVMGVGSTIGNSPLNYGRSCAIMANRQSVNNAENEKEKHKMARPKKSTKFVRVATMVEETQLQRLRKVAGFRQLESAQVTTVSEIVRIAIDEYLDGCEV